MNKKWVTIGVLGVLVLGGGYWGYKKFTTKPVAAAAVTAKAKIADVKKVISATGTVNFPHSIPLQFSNKGQVVELNIKDGDVVKKGQVLARIDDTALKTSVGQQEANLLTAQSRLQSLQDGYNPQTKAEAQSALAKAKQNLITAQQNADSAYLENQVLLAKQNVKQTSDALAKAQQNGDAASIQSAQSSLNQALSALTTAQNQQKGGAAQALASAQADVTSAQYKVDLQAAGPSEADLKSAYASISQAQAQLESAKTALAEATILAPTDAVVIDSGLQLYQYTTDDSKITITPSDETGSNLEVLAAIDQADIGQVKSGQKVDITLDAYPDEHSSGVVSLVALQGTTSSNVTTFEVTVAVDQASDKLRSGMNANMDIFVAEAKNVLTVPSEAIKTRGDQKGVMVPLSAEGSPAEKANPGSKSGGESGNKAAKSNLGQAQANSRFIPVEFGLDDGTNAEVKSGLTEGQEVIVTSSMGTSSSAGNKSGSGGIFMGGGGGRTAGSPPR